MGNNDMTDVVNLRMLASKLRKQGSTLVPEEEKLLCIAQKLGIKEWTQKMIKQNSGDFIAMLAFHMMDCGDGE